MLSCLFPSLALLGGFFASYNLINEGNGSNVFPNTHPFVFMIIMLAQAVLYFFITYIIDNRELLGANIGGVLSENYDEDVINEEIRV